MHSIQGIFRDAAPLGQQAQGLAIFTICSNNYVSMARVLVASVRRFHPEAKIYLCLADAVLPGDGFYPDDCIILPVENVEISDIQSFLFRYDIMELSMAIRPFMFQHLIRLGHDIALYLDSDIQVFSQLNQILTPLRGGASFVLTPHFCAPAEGDAFPDDIGIMRKGVYNTGFLGVRACAEAEAILAWWGRRLEYECLGNQNARISVNQKFLDFVPVFAKNAHILRDPTVNIAYWNLPQRTLSVDGATWMVDGRPLGFYHFSGFDPAKMDQLTEHSLAFRGGAIPQVLASLIQKYAEQLRANQHGSITHSRYLYGRFASGKRIPLIVRKMFRERHLVWSGDPFRTYEAYVHAPMPGQWTGSSSAIVTNLMAYLHSQEEWLQRSFDLSQSAGVCGYVDWYVRHGETYVEHSGLTEPVAERLGRRSGVTLRCPPPRRSAEETDINVIGYLKAALGLGEAGRMTLRTLAHTGLRARGLETSLNSNSKRTDCSCDHLLEPEANGRFQLFSINCDQLIGVLAHLRPRLRADAYRIMVPFWELSNLPDAWLPAAQEVDEIWAPTRFIQTTLVKKISKPVLRMPLMLDFEPPRRVERSRFGLPERSFLFFFAFDYFSFIERKNPMAVVAAFKHAFRTGDGHSPVRLVLKTMNVGEAHDSSHALHEIVHNDPDIILIENLLTREETVSLIAACDAVVTLHRSEGLGLLVAEAMVLGKPVISTDYSATTELVTPETGWPVDYRLVPVPEGGYPFHAGQVWADADIYHAAWQMRSVVGDQDAVRRKTAAARELIMSEHSVEVVARRQLARLKSLEGW